MQYGREYRHRFARIFVMSAIPSRHFPVTPTEPVFPLSVEQYHTMIEAGVLTDDDPVELLEGVLVFTMPKNPPHRYVVQTADEMIRKMLPPGWMYQSQEPITLEDGEPEPDGAVIRGSRRDYRTRHPTPRETAMVVEVADATLPRDRRIKLRSYARAGISTYWIINLIDRCIEIYQRPDQAAPEPLYLDKQVRNEGESIELVVDGVKIGQIAVRDLLP
jgi:Uma2 family endonuclease